MRHAASRPCEPLESRRLMTAVTSLTLIDADSNQPVAGFISMESGDVLDLATLPSRRLNVVANVDSAAGSVKFRYDNRWAFKIDNVASYAMAGNSGPDYHAWTPTPGTHTITATPYRKANGRGAAGRAETVTFTVIDSSLSSTPAPAPTLPTTPTTPTPIPSPTPEPVPPGVTRIVGPEQSLKTIQAAADLAVPGDTILIQPGTYHEKIRFNRSGTVDKPITFIGTDVIIDGSGFSSVLTGGQYITLKGLTVENCSNGLQNYQAAVRTGTGWRMEDVTVRGVDGTGICVSGNNVTLLGVIAEDNGQAGIGGDRCSDVYLKDCITRGNNRGAVDPVWKGQANTSYVNGLYYVNPDWEAGGGKWWATTNVTIDGMTACDNVGPGIWFDYQNANAVVKNSTAYDNDGLAHAWSGNGIRLELSTQPILIQNNTLYRNTGPQVGIESCKNVTVSGNTIMGTHVALKDWPRGSTYTLTDITVTDNVFIQSGILTEGGTWTNTSAADKSLTIDRNAYQGGLTFNWNYRTYCYSLADVRTKLGLEWNGHVV